MKRLILYSAVLICVMLISLFSYKKYKEYHYYDLNYQVSNYKQTAEKVKDKDVDSLLSLFKEIDSLKCLRDRDGEIARKVVYDRRLLGKNEKIIRGIFGVPNEVETDTNNFKTVIYYSACICDSNNKVIKNSVYGRINFQFYKDKLFNVNEMYE